MERHAYELNDECKLRSKETEVLIKLINKPLCKTLQDVEQPTYTETESHNVVYHFDMNYNNYTYETTIYAVMANYDTINLRHWNATH